MAFVTPQNMLTHLKLAGHEKIVDVGAGSGAYSIAAAKLLVNGGKVYATDVNRDLLSKLSNEAIADGLSNIETIWADVEIPHAIKVHDNYIDIAILSNVLFQLEDKNGALNEIYRILKPGGVLLVIDWSDSFGGMGPATSAVITEPTAKQMLTEHHFTIGESVDAGDHHWGIIAYK